MYFRTSVPELCYYRQCVRAPDGGHFTLDWVHEASTHREASRRAAGALRPRGLLVSFHLLRLPS